MKNKINFIAILYLVFFSSINIYGQKQFQSVYKYSGLLDSITIANKELPNSKGLGIYNDIKIGVGDIVYVNHCNDSLSMIDISLIPSDGISALDKNGNDIAATIQTNFNNGCYFAKSYEDEKSLVYYLPSLTKTGISKKINGFEASLYQYSNKENLLIEIWFSKSISDKVNLGFNYKLYGGLVKISYFTKKYSFSFDLINFSEEKKFLKTLNCSVVNTGSIKKLHPMFIVD